MRRGLAEDDGLDQGVGSMVVVLQSFQQLADQAFILRLRGAAKGKGGEAAHGVPDELVDVVLLQGQPELSGDLDLRAARKPSGGVHRPARLLAAITPDGIKVLQGETDRVDLVMTAGAGFMAAVCRELLAQRPAPFARLVIQQARIGRWLGQPAPGQVFQDPLAANHRTGAIVGGRGGEDGGHAEKERKPFRMV